MKKKKQSKKKWAWTEAQKRKHWSLNLPSWSRGPTREFIVEYHRANRAYEKAMINKIINGYLDEDSYIGIKYHPSCAKWFWW